MVSITAPKKIDFILSPALAKADTLIKKTRPTDAVTMMGQTQPAKDEACLNESIPVFIFPT